MGQFKKCANGCNAPVDPPSKAICRKCQEKITQTLKKMIADLYLK